MVHLNKIIDPCYQLKIHPLFIRIFVNFEGRPGPNNMAKESPLLHTGHVNTFYSNILRLFHVVLDASYSCLSGLMNSSDRSIRDWNRRSK